MGTYVFTWSQPASEVYVTGTFDDWKKTAKLDKENGVFTRKVDLPFADKPILYKFVVDGTWTVDNSMPLESDDSGNVNNLLKPADISRSSHPASGPIAALLSGVLPGASTVDKAGQVPLEKGAAEQEAMPGDSAKSGEKTFSVNPLPATAGTGNPINLKPGEPVPPTSSFTSNTIEHAARTDQAAYEKSDAYPTSGEKTLDTKDGAFGVPPVSGTMIPESSLPMGGNATTSADGSGPFIQSAGPGTTTAALAGKVPLEPRGQAEVVKDGPQESDSTVMTAAATAGGAVAGVAAGAAAMAAGVPASIQKAISSMSGGDTAAAEEPKEPVDTVPETVKHAQAEAHASPEASGNAEAVTEKSEVEKELMKKVARTDEAGEPAPAVSATQSAVAPVAQGSAAPTAEHTAQSSSAFSKDPIIADDSTAAAIGAMNTGSTAQPAAFQGDPVAAGQSGKTAETSGGLNATAQQPAKSAATESGAEKQTQTQTLPGSSKEAVRQDSRDVSPMSKPTVTSGIESTTAASAQGDSKTKASASRDQAADSTATDKKNKRRSFFGKIKDKLKN